MGIGNFGSRNRSRQSRVAAADCDIKGAASHREPDGPEGAGCSPSRFNAEGSPSSKVRTAALCGSIIEIRPVLGTAVPCSATSRLFFWERMTLVGARKPEAKTGAGTLGIACRHCREIDQSETEEETSEVFHGWSCCLGNC